MYYTLLTHTFHVLYIKKSPDNRSDTFVGIFIAEKLNNLRY